MSRRRDDCVRTDATAAAAKQPLDVGAARHRGGWRRRDNHRWRPERPLPRSFDFTPTRRLCQYIYYYIHIARRFITIKKKKMRLSSLYMYIYIFFLFLLRKRFFPLSFNTPSKFLTSFKYTHYTNDFGLLFLSFYLSTPPTPSHEHIHSMTCSLYFDSSLIHRTSNITITIHRTPYVFSIYLYMYIHTNTNVLFFAKC